MELRNLKLGHIELFVKDPAVAKDFYVGVLGFQLVDVQADKFVWVASGGVSILLRPGGAVNQSNQYGDATAGIVLYTDDLDQTASELRARGLVFCGIDGSPRCLTFTDLDGHWFQLVNPEDH